MTSSSHTPISLKTAACLIGSIAVIAAGTVTAVILHGKARERSFSKLATPAFTIPGLNEGFVPQDLALIKNGDNDASADQDSTDNST